MSSKLRCSFCRKSEDDVRKLVAGPNVYICDTCVKIATDIMEREDAPRPLSRVKSLFRRLFGFRVAVA